MTSTLAALRRTPQPTPEKFLGWQPGCWVQYYDDTPAKDPAKAISARGFDPAVARRKQEDRCAVCFSLQAFGAARTKAALLCYRNMGVDIDLLSAAERRLLTRADIDRRKEEYLARRLLPFPLTPHWLIETRHGFHAVFRVRPQRSAEGVRDAWALNARLVRALGGDPNAALLTQVLRVPGTFQFKRPDQPFLCRLLLDDAGRVRPYELDAVRGVLDALEVFHEPRRGEAVRQAADAAADGKQATSWRGWLGGAPEGQRNCAAASVVGGILARLPEGLWETGGWGGLKEWNGRNSPPLPERELRAVYESIARRERSARKGGRAWAGPGGDLRLNLRVDVQVESPGGVRSNGGERAGSPSAGGSSSTSPSGNDEH